MDKILYQVAPMHSLMMGYYYGFVTYDELLKLGDTGIGTFEGLDGEMITVDGEVYRADFDCNMVKMDTSAKTPYCVMTKFVPDFEAEIRDVKSLADMGEKLDKALPVGQRNLFHVAKLHCALKSITVRSVLGSEPPYEITGQFIAGTQKALTLENVSGTAIAVRCPNYMDRLNMPGWHLHFITDDRKLGGHVLDIVGDAACQISAVNRYELFLPKTDIFGSLELLNVSNEAINKAET